MTRNSLAFGRVRRACEIALALAAGHCGLPSGGSRRGCLVIDLNAAGTAEPGSLANIAERDGDWLAVPRRTEAITDNGEVQNTILQLSESWLRIDDKLHLSGGVTGLAGANKPYVLRADGSGLPDPAHFWSRAGRDAAIKLGDKIVVPVDTKRVPTQTTWQAVTAVLHNVAIAEATVHAL